MPTRRRSLLGLTLTLVIGIPIALLVVWPQAYGAASAPIIAQLIAFRAPLAIGLGVVALVAATVAVVRRRWAIAAGLAVVLTVSSLANGVILTARGSQSVVADGDLTVLVWNTQGGATPSAAVARLIRDTDADIVSLPEMDETTASEVVRLLAAEGRAYSADTTYGGIEYSEIPTSVLVAESLAPYRQDESAGSTPGLPSGVWRPADGEGPTIVAAHPFPPLPAGMSTWRSGLDWIADLCDDPHVIVAGDLNATVDHLAGWAKDGGQLGRCHDAALATGSAALGTWPVSVPTWLAAPIDHVLFGSAWTARSVSVVTPDDDGTDHRALIAVLDRR